MKVYEILNTTQHLKKRFKLSDIDRTKEKYIGDAEGSLQIWEYGVKNSKSTLFVLTQKDKSPLSYLMGEFVKFQNADYLIVQDVFTTKDNLKKGYASALYYSLITKHHYKIISDKEQTADGRRLWSSLRKRIKAKIYDNHAKKFYDDDGTIPEADLYSNFTDVGMRYRLILEVKNNMNEGQTGIPEVGRGILSNYLIFTAEEDWGKYE